MFSATQTLLALNKHSFVPAYRRGSPPMNRGDGGIDILQSNVHTLVGLGKAQERRSDSETLKC